MNCAECDGPCSIYDGGESNDYRLRVWVCDDCGAWQDEETDDEPDDDATLIELLLLLDGGE